MTMSHYFKKPKQQTKTNIIKGAKGIIREEDGPPWRGRSVTFNDQKKQANRDVCRKKLENDDV